jgi:hypothetical protein
MLIVAIISSLNYLSFRLIYRINVISNKHVIKIKPRTISLKSKSHTLLILLYHFRTVIINTGNYFPLLFVSYWRLELI